jgi:amino acid transporter
MAVKHASAPPDTAAPGARAASPRKLLNVWSASALVIANTIGAGVFTTSGFALADLGAREWVMLAWVLGGIYAFCGVAIYADLAEQYPESGGEYAILRHTVHPAAGIVAGWISCIAGFTAPIAAAAWTAQVYLQRSVALESTNVPWIASAVLLSLTLMHSLSPRQGVLVQSLGVLLKVVAVSAFIVLGARGVLGGIAALPSERSAPLSFAALGGSLVWISYAYSGWNAAIYVAAEVEGGGKAVKRALFAGTAVVAVLYLGISAVILYSTPMATLRGVPESGAISAEALGGKLAGRALASVIALGLLTSVSSMLVSGPRVAARMATDGALPALFAKGFATPRRAVLAQGLLSLAVVWIASLREILEFVGITLSLSAGAVAASWLRLELRRTGPRKGLIACGVVFLTVTCGIMVGALNFRPGSAAAALVLLVLATIAAWKAGAFRDRAASQ